MRRGFTLIEILISIGLLSLMMPALFSSVDALKRSNKHLEKYLFNAQDVTRGAQVLFHDIASSDGNLTIKKDEFPQLCIGSTNNSLYGLSEARVCWVVLKEKNTLARIEGWEYTLPIRREESVEVDKVIENLELFDVHHEKDKVLVVIKEEGKKKKPISYLIQGIHKPPPPKKKNTPQNNTKNPNNAKNPNSPIPVRNQGGVRR